ncbi:PaaI family thioesterase [Phenylobacterium sp. LjRoot225]|uniref:PaaI family thioesterase n=1 Tax=Phenylobacterium sp. LjRoot225 TaxID=3342285 RepID=UPI003ED0CDC8
MRDESSSPEPSSEPSHDHAWPDRGRLSADVAVPYGEMIDLLRGFLDKVSGARPDPATLADLTHDLKAWSERLQACAVEERDQLFARLLDQPGRGQTMSPALVVEKQEVGDFRGHVTFGRYFLGVNGAVHGGTLPLMFDEVLGRAAGQPGLRLRTAYLKTDFRALTPLDTRLEVRGWLDRQEGRKYFVRGELRHGDVVCADAEGLFVALKPDQR